MDENPADRGMLSTPELIRDLTAAIRKQDWKPEELQLKQQEVRNARRSVRAGMITAIASMAAVMVAAVAAFFAGKAVAVAQMAIANQAKEARFSTALHALGGDQPAERVAGAIMLRRNVEDRLASAQNAQDHRDAFNLYLTTEDILENYLRTPVGPPSSATPASAPAVTASGQNSLVAAPAARPGPPREHMDVAQQLAKLLSKENQGLVRKFNNTKNPSVDLANARLVGQYWPRVDFSWLDGKYFSGIDLRLANLTGSRWGNATLTAASLQCANLAGSRFNIDEGNRLVGARLNGAKLQHANLQNVDLRFADLRGADLTGAYVDGARFDGAELDGATTKGVIGTSGDGKLPQGEQKREEFDVKRCMDNGWDQ